MRHIEIAKKLFVWNTANLVSKADLRKEDLAMFFAPTFQIKANGRIYNANYENYYEFLNQFRSTIKTISYTFEEIIETEDKVVLPLTADIERINGFKETFAAILILEFSQPGQIVLWHEVYVKSSENCSAGLLAN